MSISTILYHGSTPFDTTPYTALTTNYTQACNTTMTTSKKQKTAKSAV